MGSREAFAREACGTLVSRHGSKPDESFVMGVSGRWGEGKTRFLQLLELELAKVEADRPFVVLWLNPWKYSSDSNSFMRNLLRQLQAAQCPSQRAWELVRWFWTGRRPLEELTFDVTSVGIRVWVLVLALVGSWLAWLVYWGPLHDSLSRLQTPLALVAVPVMVAVLVSSLALRRGSKQVETPDRFDTILDSLLERMSDRRVVVFVDDLDRVSATTARLVLDNLRTFFDKPQLSFVVTGDHSVLERSLGLELLGSEASRADRLEEGRRFLKKIFDLYWRLPQLVDSEFQSFLDVGFRERAEELDQFFDADQLASLKAYAEQYFDKNLRHVLRFLDMTLLMMRMVRMQAKAAEGPGSEYLADLLAHPVQVVRVAMFQDLCTPFFELLLKSPNVLYDLEYLVDTRNPDFEARLETEVAGAKLDLTAGQDDFLRRFLFEKPRFYENTRLCVRDVRPFLYLAGDAGFGDNRGPKPDDFVAALRVGDLGQVTQNLKLTGRSMLAAGHDALLEYLGLRGPSDETVDLVDTLLEAALTLPAIHEAHDVLFEQGLADGVVGSYDATSPERRVRSLRLWWRWADLIGPSGVTGFAPIWRYRTQQDLDLLVPQDIKGAGLEVACDWFTIALEQDAARALERMNELLVDLDSESSRACLDPVHDALLEGIKLDADPARRTLRLRLLCRNTLRGVTSAKAMLTGACESLDWPTIDWLRGLSDESWTPLTDTEIRSNMMNGLLARDRPAFDDALRQVAARISSAEADEAVWRRLLADAPAKTIEVLLANASSEIEGLAPQRLDVAAELFELVGTAASERENVEERIALMQLLHRDTWIWRCFPPGEWPRLSRLGGMKRSRDQRVAAAAQQVSDSWTGVRPAGASDLSAE